MLSLLPTVKLAGSTRRQAQSSSVKLTCIDLLFLQTSTFDCNSRKHLLENKMGSNNRYNWQDFQPSRPCNFLAGLENPQFKTEASDIKDEPQFSPWTPNDASPEFAEIFDKSFEGCNYLNHPDYPSNFCNPHGKTETTNAGSTLGTSEEASLMCGDESPPFPAPATAAEVIRQQRKQDNEWADRSWKMFVMDEGHRIATTEAKRQGQAKWDEHTKAIWSELEKGLSSGTQAAAGRSVPWESTPLDFYVRNGILLCGGSCKYSGKAPARFMDAEVIISFCQVGRLSRREAVEDVEWMSARSTTAAGGGATRKRTKNEVDNL